MHDTARVKTLSVAPHALGHDTKSGADQANVTQAAVAAHFSSASGLTPVQLPAFGATLPSFPMHDTARVNIDSAAPHSAGHGENSGADQLAE